MYNYYHFFPTDEAMQGKSIKCIEMPPFIENAVQFVAKEQAQGLLLDLYYSEKDFEDLSFLDRLSSISSQIISGSDKLNELVILFPEERKQQLLTLNTQL